MSNTIYIKTNKGDYQENIDKLYQECTPARIINDLRLKSVKYYETAKFGHFGLPGFPWEK